MRLPLGAVVAGRHTIPRRGGRGTATVFISTVQAYYTPPLVSTVNAHSALNGSRLRVCIQDADSWPERAALPAVGEQIRKRRLALDLSVRELARRLTLSPSLISQIERGKACLGSHPLREDHRVEHLAGCAVRRADAQGRGAPGGAARDLPTPRGLKVLDAQLRGNGDAGCHRAPGGDARRAKVIQLESGVRWDRLTQSPDPNVDFLSWCTSRAEPRARAPTDASSGREYGYVLSGPLEVTVGFENHVLGPGDSISFDSTMPHRLATVGDEPVEAIWFAVGPPGDPRIADCARPRRRHLLRGDRLGRQALPGDQIRPADIRAPGDQ